MFSVYVFVLGCLERLPRKGRESVLRCSDPREILHQRGCARESTEAKKVLRASRRTDAME